MVKDTRIEMLEDDNVIPTFSKYPKSSMHKIHHIVVLANLLNTNLRAGDFDLSLRTMFNLISVVMSVFTRMLIVDRIYRDKNGKAKDE